MKQLLPSFLLLIFLSCNPILAETITVSGDVSGTWSADTVLVRGEILVPSGQVLHIEPGVSVLFLQYFRFTVEDGATLIATGTEAEPILFDQFSPGIHWGGIRFINAADSSRMEYCHIRHGWATGGSTYDNGGGIFCDYTDIELINCLIDGCSADFFGGGVYLRYSDASIISCTFSGNWSYGSGGGLFCSDSNPTITDCKFSGNWCRWYGGAIHFHYSDGMVEANGIVNNFAETDGAGIYSTGSDPIISCNQICDNLALRYGGGILCIGGSDATISKNIIAGNSGLNNGGGIYVSDSSPYIYGNFISGNSANWDGGGIRCKGSCSPHLEENIVTQNTVGSSGGGINCNSSEYTIIGNSVIGNSAGLGGGIFSGQYGSGSQATISDNIVCNNTAGDGGGIYIDDMEILTFWNNHISRNQAVYGGGLYLYRFSTLSSNNTLYGNTSTQGGGIWFDDCYPTLKNFIIWGNTPNQIEPEQGIYISYSDIQGGWEGIGNIDADPLFVNGEQNDGRLLWGSPCIDAGDLNSPLDPDTTIADIGAYFYDQRELVRILITPHCAPIAIPALGGMFEYSITLSNCTGSTLQPDVWCDVTLPDSTLYGLVVGPASVDVMPGSNLSQIRNQFVPSLAPIGLYRYNGYAVVGADTSMDSFVFWKLGSDSLTGASGWITTGEPFGEYVDLYQYYSVDSEKITTVQAHPNPFNPTTTISFALPQSGKMLLSVYDISGRLVATLVDGYRVAGTHDVTFDGSDLPSHE
jgi:hypothetical protein